MEPEGKKVNGIGVFDGCRWSVMNLEGRSGATLNQRVAGSSPAAPTNPGKRSPAAAGLFSISPDLALIGEQVEDQVTMAEAAQDRMSLAAVMRLVIEEMRQRRRQRLHELFRCGD